MNQNYDQQGGFQQQQYGYQGPPPVNPPQAQYDQQQYDQQQYGGQQPPQSFDPQQQQYQQQTNSNTSGYQYHQYLQQQQMQPIATQQTQNYQGHVEGLRGWNDPPKSEKEKAEEVENAKLLEGIDSASGIIVSGLEKALQTVNERAHPSQKRLIEDTEKRLDALFDALANDTIDKNTLAQLFSLTKAINVNDFNAANSIVLHFMTTISLEDNKWVMGTKRLLELYQRVL